MLKNAICRCAVLALALVALPVGSASATVLYYEGFDYAPGPVDGSPTDWDHSFGGALTPTFDAGSLAYPLLAPTGNHLAQNDPIGSELPYTVNYTASINTMFSTAGTYYYTILGKVQTDQSGLDGLGALVHYALPNYTSDQGYIQLAAQANGGNEISFAMEVGRPSGATTLPYTPAVVYPGTFLLAMRVINDGNTGLDDVRLVVNPDLSLGEPDWTSPTLMVTNRDITSAVSANALIYFGRAHEWDEIRVATTWAEAAPLIPEPASLALMGLGALVMLGRKR